MWNMVLNGIVYEANLLCPYRWNTVRCHKPIWYNSSLTSLATERDGLFNAFNRSKGKNVNIYWLAVSKRKEHNREVKKSKENYFKECLRLNKDNCNAFWKNINDLIGTTIESEVNRVFKHNTTYLCSEEESVGVINNFFASVGERLSKWLRQVAKFIHVTPMKNQ